MNAEQAINRAVGAAHAMLSFDQSGSMTAQREAEKAARAILLSYMRHQMLVLELRKKTALAQLINVIPTLEEEGDRRGVEKIVKELEKMEL